MPHRRVPNAIKRQMRDAQNLVPPYARGTEVDTRAVAPMVTKGNVIYLPGNRQRIAAWNQIPRMSQGEIEVVQNLIDRRYDSADKITQDQAQKMFRQEKMYNGEFIDPEHEKEEHIYLAKAREALQVVHAFLYGMVLQVPKLLEFRPAPTTLNGLDSQWRSAKLSEALTNYYFDDLWKIRHTVLRDFIKVFLKFSVAIIKTDYFETGTQPDLRFSVVDRALQHFDPNAHKIKECKWWIETEFWERSAIEEMFQMGYWARPLNLPDMVPSIFQSALSDNTLRRFFGDTGGAGLPVDSDQLVEVRFYRQAPIKGLDHRYAVQLGGTGGWMVAYGPNPFPSKEMPYSGDSFDRHEWQVDGHSLLDMHASINEVVNTLLNIRLDDVRQNLWSPRGVAAAMIDDTTLDDIANRSKFVRLNDKFIEGLINAGKKLSDYSMEMGINANSSSPVYQDIQFLLGQENQAGHAGDVFRGQSPSKVTTAQEVHEVLSKNQGAFQPAFMSIMQTVEDMGQTANSYFRSRDFYGEERIMLATGGRYQDVVKQWDFDNGEVRAASVSFDQMNTDVTIRATNGAEAMLARTFRASVTKELISSIGQVEGLFPELQDRFDMVPIIMDMFRGVVSDIDQFERPLEEVAQRQQARQAAQKQAQAEQIQLEALRERASVEAKTSGELQKIQTRAAVEASRDAMNLQTAAENAMREMLAKHDIEFKNEMKKMLVEHAFEIQKMILDAKLETPTAESSKSKVSV